MKVICKDNDKGNWPLTLEKAYEVLDTHRGSTMEDDSYKVVNDDGDVDEYWTGYFVPVDDKPAELTGGSSSYYDLKIVRKDGSVVECTVQDIITSILGDSFNFGNIFKAMVRICGKRKGGGKSNTSEQYDLKKIKWFADDMVGRVGEIQQ